MRWLDSVTDSMDINMSKLWEMVKVREAWRAAIYGVAKSWTQVSEQKKSETGKGIPLGRISQNLVPDPLT